MYRRSLNVSENSENSKVRRRNSIFLTSNPLSKDSNENEFIKLENFEKGKVKKRCSTDFFITYEESNFLKDLETLEDNKNELISKKMRRLKKEDCIDLSEKIPNRNCILKSKIRRLNSIDKISEFQIIDQCKSIEFANKKSFSIENEKCDNNQIKSMSKSSNRSIFVMKNNNCIKYIDKRLTVTLFLINISFMVMTMPAVILQIFFSKSNIIYWDMVKHFQNEESLKEEEYLYYYNLLKAISELLQYLNHSTNFIFYCLSGKTFRDEVKEFLKSIF
jgi:hypothetical protein